MHERLQVIIDVHDGVDALPLLHEVLCASNAVLVQLRAKTLTDRRFFELAENVVRRCRERDVRCIIDDRVDIALAAGADGVHVGQGDLPLPQARRLLGDRAIVGATARDVDTARRCEVDGATYIGCGPVFPTRTKLGLPHALGVQYVCDVASSVDIPVFAIGGITVDATSDLRRYGCHGVAVIGAIANADDPRIETQRFLDVLQHEAVAS